LHDRHDAQRTVDSAITCPRQPMAPMFAAADIDRRGVVPRGEPGGGGKLADITDITKG
jgi:hypothetical protein